MDKPDISELDWAGLEASVEWKTVLLPYLKALEERAIDLLVNAPATEAGAAELRFAQARLSVLREIAHAPEHFRGIKESLAKNEREAGIRYEDEDERRRERAARANRYGSLRG